MDKVERATERLFSKVPDRICALCCIFICLIFLPWEILKGFKCLWVCSARNVKMNVWHWWQNGMKASIKWLIQGSR